MQAIAEAKPVVQNTDEEILKDLYKKQEAIVSDLKAKGNLLDAQKEAEKLKGIAATLSQSETITEAQKIKINDLADKMAKEIQNALQEKYQKYFDSPKVAEALVKLVQAGKVSKEDLEKMEKGDAATKKRVTAQVLQKILSDPNADPALVAEVKNIIAKLKLEGKDDSTGNVLDFMGRSRDSIRDLVGERNLLALYKTNIYASMKQFDEELKKVDKLRDDEVKRELKANGERSQRAQESNYTEANRQAIKKIEQRKNEIVSRFGAHIGLLLLMRSPDGNISPSALQDLGLGVVVELIEAGILQNDPNLEKFLMKEASPDVQQRLLSKMTWDAMSKEHQVT